MLETLREYAAQHLAAAGERADVGRRHLGQFLEVAEQAHRERQTRGLNAEVQALMGEQDNVRAALAFAQVSDPAAQVRLAAACEQLWLAGRANEGRHWLGEALARAPEATTERVRALNSAAALAALGQMREEANRLLDESLALSATLDDRDGEAGARLWLAFRDLTSDPPGASNARRSLALHEAVGDRLGVCRSLLFLGVALGVKPERREASRRALERAVRLARELDDGWAEGFARSFLGHADIDDGKRELAASHFRAALQAEVLGPVRGQALDGFARLALERDPRRAIRLLGAARAMRERYGGRAPPWRERVNEATRAKAERRLDALASHEAWEDGLAMSTEQAIAHALEDIDAAA
jgi:non-specific serine/threonine protein kinase